MIKHDPATFEARCNAALEKARRLMEPPKERRMKFRQPFEAGIACESITVDFRFPGNPVDGLALSLLVAGEAAVYRPFRWYTDHAHSVDPNSAGTAMLTLAAGRIRLMTCTLGSKENDRFPTLRVQLKPNFIYLYGADTLVYRILNRTLLDTFPKWELHGAIRDITAAYDIAEDINGLLIWREYLHRGGVNMKYQFGNCTLIDRRKQLAEDCGVELPTPMTSLQWHIHPREPMELFIGARKIKNPMQGMGIFRRAKTIDTIAQLHPSVLASLMGGLQNPSLFPYAVQTKLSYHLRNKLLGLLYERADVDTLNDNEWDIHWRDALNRHRSLSYFAA